MSHDTLRAVEPFWLYQKRAGWHFCSLFSSSLLFLYVLKKHIQFSSQAEWEKRRLPRPASKNILYQFQHFRKITVWYSNINKKKKKETLLQRCLSAHALCISCLRQKFSILFMKPISYKTGMSSRHCILMNFKKRKRNFEFLGNKRGKHRKKYS